MTKLANELTLFGLIMVAIGSCIGSGIFVTTPQTIWLLLTDTLIHDPDQAFGKIN